MLRRRILIGIALVALVGAACAEPRMSEAGDAPLPANQPDKGGPPIDWEDPYGGPMYASTTAVENALAFKVKVPAFGKPDRITTPDPGQFAPGTLPVGLIYHFPTEGTVLVEEKLAGDETVEHLRELAATYGPEQADGIPDGPAAPTDALSPGPVPDPMVIVSVRGTDALLIQGDGLGRLMWIEGPLLIDIAGPQLTVEQVIALAEKF